MHAGCLELSNEYTVELLLNTQPPAHALMKAQYPKNFSSIRTQNYADCLQKCPPILIRIFYGRMVTTMDILVTNLKYVVTITSTKREKRLENQIQKKMMGKSPLSSLLLEIKNTKVMLVQLN